MLRPILFPRLDGAAYASVVRSVRFAEAYGPYMVRQCLPVLVIDERHHSSRSFWCSAVIFTT